MRELRRTGAKLRRRGASRSRTVQSQPAVVLALRMARFLLKQRAVNRLLGTREQGSRKTNWEVRHMRYSFGGIWILSTALLQLSCSSANNTTDAGLTPDASSTADAGAHADASSTTDASIALHRVGESCASAAECAAPLSICNTDPGGQCTADCTTPADCAAIPGAICESQRPGHCYKECTSKADCPRDGYDCIGGPNPEGKKWCDVQGGVGDACMIVAQCAPPLSICNMDPGGQCTADCARQSDCAAIPGAVCETQRPGHCYKECTTKADCPRDGYDCIGGPNPEGKKWCDVQGGVGDACTIVAECAPPLSICNMDPGGQCTADCTTQADCTAIPGAVCETQRPGHCYKECTSKADCPRDGYDCIGGPNPEGKKWCDVQGGVGDACTIVAECAPPLSICNMDPGGQCTADCTTQADCTAIPGAVCETQRPGHCYKECMTNADCPRTGYGCVGGPSPEGKKWCDVL
jgi:hypothetical protein